MTNYLEPEGERFRPRKKKYTPKDNFEELQNEGHEFVTEDFSDSPFADNNKNDE